MNRRAFFGAMVGGVATAAAVRTWPFRTYFFPSTPIVAGDIAITLSGDRFQLGQMIAIYSASGGLARGAYRIIDVGEDPRTWRVEYVEKMPARDFLWKPNESQWAAWRSKDPVTLSDPIASPLKNFSLHSVRSRWQRLIKGA